MVRRSLAMSGLLTYVPAYPSARWPHENIGSAMKNLILTAAALAGLAVIPTFGQTGALPRLANEKPDLNGVWERPYVPDMTRSTANGSQKGPGQLPFTTEYAQLFKDYDPAK